VSFLETVWLIVRKDLTIEFRSREIAYTTLFFAVAVVLVFAFALVKEGVPPVGASAAVLWIAILFAGNLALGRTFERERQAETLRALLLAPVSRPAIYTGKLLALMILLSASEVLLVPLVAFLFQEPLLRHPIWLAVIVLTGTTGFAAVGTLFAAMLVRARSRDMLLPLLLYTITVPVIIAGVGATSSLLQPEINDAIVRFWTVLLTCFDVVFVTIALWTFDAVMAEQ
jgi:heme exporter protein B